MNLKSRLIRWLFGVEPHGLQESHERFIGLDEAMICMNPDRRGANLAVGVCGGCSPSCLLPVRSLWNRFYAGVHLRIAREYGKQKATGATVAPGTNAAAYLTAPESRLKH